MTLDFGRLSILFHTQWLWGRYCFPHDRQHEDAAMVTRHLGFVSAAWHRGGNVSLYHNSDTGTVWCRSDSMIQPADLIDLLTKIDCEHRFHFTVDGKRLLCN